MPEEKKDLAKLLREAPRDDLTGLPPLEVMYAQTEMILRNSQIGCFAGMAAGLAAGVGLGELAHAYVPFMEQANQIADIIIRVGTDAILGIGGGMAGAIKGSIMARDYTVKKYVNPDFKK